MKLKTMNQIRIQRFLNRKLLSWETGRHIQYALIATGQLKLSLWFGIGEKVKIFPWGICVSRFAPLVKNLFQFQLISDRKRGTLMVEKKKKNKIDKKKELLKKIPKRDI